MDDAPTPFHAAIRDLGGQSKAAAVLGRTQSTLSEALNRMKQPSAELSMAIEIATKGKYTCEQLRPDLANLFSAIRRRPKTKKRAA